MVGGEVIVFFGLWPLAIQGSILPRQVKWGSACSRASKAGSPKTELFSRCSQRGIGASQPQPHQSADRRTPVPAPLGLARVSQSRRKDIAEKVTAALAARMEGRAGVAGDRNSFRIPAGGWLHSVDLQEPREVVSSPGSLPHPLPLGEPTNQPEPQNTASPGSQQGDDTLVPAPETLLPSQRHTWYPEGPTAFPIPFMEQELTEQETAQVLGRSPREQVRPGSSNSHQYIGWHQAAHVQRVAKCLGREVGEER